MQPTNGRRTSQTGHARSPAHNALTKARRAISVLAVAIVLTTALGSCGGSSKGPAAPRLALSGCVVQEIQARCGSLKVAENPADPNGRKITLRVVVLPAISADRAADPLFYFEGGPGGAATNEATWVSQHFTTLNLHHDIVLVDQRGTGGSNPVTCSKSAVTGATGDAQIAAAVQACLTSLNDKADPRYYTTPIAVDDVDQVRAALGYDKVDLYGVSYGVSSALTYIQRHGAHVRAAVLDSGSLLDVHLWELIPLSSQQALASLFARCQSSLTCASAFPHLQADFTIVTTQLARAPITTTVVDPATGSPVRLDLPTFMGMLISTYLATPEGSTSFPRDIHAAAGGDWSAILKLFANSESDSASPILVMSVTIRCSDAWASLDPTRVAAVAPSSPFTPYEVAFASGNNAICKYWPHAAGASGSVTTSAPIVFLNGTADPVDPPANVANAHVTMPNSLVVPVTETGHWQLDFDPNSCLTDATNNFLDKGLPSTAQAWTCAGSMPLPAFIG